MSQKESGFQFKQLFPFTNENVAKSNQQQQHPAKIENNSEDLTANKNHDNNYLSKGLNRFKSLFNKQPENPAQAVDVQKPVLKENESQSSENSSLLSKVLQKTKDKLQSGKNKISSVTNKVAEASKVVQNWKEFAIMFIVGIFFILLSLTFIPLIPISPAKFSGLFSFGSISIMSSFIVLKGWKAYLNSMFTKEKILYSSLYVISLLGTLYFSLIRYSYIFTLLFLIVQVISISFVVAANFPFGVQGVKIILRKILGCCTYFLKKCFNLGKSQILPI